jgi:hypothetical protein
MLPMHMAHPENPNGGRLLWVAVVLCTALFALPGAAQEGAFRCDGTDPYLFEEMREAGWVGYGETWDFFTCTEGGQDIYTAAASKRFKDLRLQRPRKKLGLDIDVEFYTSVVPTVAFGSLAMVVLVAGLIAAIQIRRRKPPALVNCPSCTLQVPIPVDDPKQTHLFCPGCGQASFSVERTDGGEPEVRARLLA